MTKTKKPRGVRLSVNVTADHISEGVTASSSHCMIAEAIKAAYPSAKKVAVDISTCRFTDPEKGHRYVFLTPRVAQSALVDFDEGTMPAPFSFRLTGAHVTAMRGTAEKDKSDKVLSRATLASSDRGSRMPRRLGGSRPPQLHLRREFGVRAFRGATTNRLNALAAQQQAEEGNHAE